MRTQIRTQIRSHEIPDTDPRLASIYPQHGKLDGSSLAARIPTPPPMNALGGLGQLPPSSRNCRGVFRLPAREVHFPKLIVQQEKIQYRIAIGCEVLLFQTERQKS